MPEGKRSASATMVPWASRLTCQQSSMFTNLKPAACKPLETIASAISLISFSETSQANLFQLFHPIGGVLARVAGSAGSEATEKGPVERTSSERTQQLTTESRERWCMEPPEIISNVTAYLWELQALSCPLFGLPQKSSQSSVRGARSVPSLMVLQSASLFHDIGAIQLWE